MYLLFPLHLLHTHTHTKEVMDQPGFQRRPWFLFEGLVDLILIFNNLHDLFIVRLSLFFQITLEIDVIYLNRV